MLDRAEGLSSQPGGKEKLGSLGVSVEGTVWVDLLDLEEVEEEDVGGGG